MCIRDSFIPVRTNRIDRIFHCLFIKRPDIFTLRILANTELLLERTHALLAIKEPLYERGIARQILLRQGIRWTYLDKPLQAYIGPEHGNKTVSYTHLDVYKRQVVVGVVRIMLGEQNGGRVVLRDFIERYLVRFTS